MHAASAAVQKRLSPAACEAFQQSVAAAVDSSLKLYRERLQQARQALLQTELGNLSSTAQHQSGQPCAAAEGQQAMGTAAVQQASSALSSQANSTSSSGHGAALAVSTGAPAAGAAAADAALLTMQQLVALLAQRDAAPELPACADTPAESAQPIAG